MTVWCARALPWLLCRTHRPVCAQCLKFQTDQQQDIKRFEKLNNLMLMQMCGKNPREAEEEGAHCPTTLRTPAPSAVLRACTTLSSADGAKPEDRPKSSEDAGGKRRKGKR